MKLMKSTFNTQALFTLILVIGIAACATGKRRVITNFKGTSSAQAPGVLTIRTGWVKEKKTSFNTELWFINDSKGPIAIPLGKVICSQAGHNGAFRLDGYDARFLELEPQQQRTFVAICSVPDPEKGDWAFTFKDIAVRTDSPDEGKILVKQLVLKLSPAETGNSKE